MLRKALSTMARQMYRLPMVGPSARKLVERAVGRHEYEDPAFWNKSLRGWAAPYLGGTLSIDLRNQITVLLAKRFAPSARSALDLGCAGGSLAMCLGPDYTVYTGVDISEVAIEAARSNTAGRQERGGLQVEFATSSVQDFKPARAYDLIVFNEVLYYLPLATLAGVVKGFVQSLTKEGIIIVSLKDDAISQLAAKEVMKCLAFQQAVIYQQMPMYAGWTITKNRETPAYLVQAFRSGVTRAQGKQSD